MEPHFSKHRRQLSRFIHQARPLKASASLPAGAVNTSVPALQRHVTDADEKPRRRWKLVGDRVSDIGGVLKDRLNAPKGDRARSRATPERAKSSSAQVIQIDPALLEKFGRTMLENLAGESIPFRRADLQSPIRTIGIDDGQIQVNDARTGNQLILLSPRVESCFSSRGRLGYLCNISADRFSIVVYCRRAWEPIMSSAFRSTLHVVLSMFSTAAVLTTNSVLAGDLLHRQIDQQCRIQSGKNADCGDLIAVRRAGRDSTGAMLAKDYAFLKYQAKDYVGALSEINSAIKKDPDLENGASFTLRGSIYYALGDFKSALADYNEALRRGPNDYYAYASRGLVFSQAKQYDAAAADFRQAITLTQDPTEKARCYYNLGIALTGLDKHQEAITAYDMSIGYNSRMTKAYVNRGYERYALQDLVAAIADSDKAIGLEPDHISAYTLRALTNIAGKNWEKASSDLGKIRSLGGDIAPTPDPDIAKIVALLAAHDSESKGPAGSSVVSERTPPVVASIVTSSKTGPSPAPAADGKHFAVVIGEDNYPALPTDQKLKNAANDAQAMSSILRDLGYKVRLGNNLSRIEINKALADVVDAMQPSDTIVFYFAGHGVAINGANYLVPSDLPRQVNTTPDNVTDNSIKESDIIEKFQAKRVNAIIILDACRNNPFRAAANTRALGNSGGLVEQQRRGVFGLFEMYSAGYDQTALDSLNDDDKVPNSVFTRVLVRTIRENPRMALPELAWNVRKGVYDLASSVGQEQTPAYMDQTLDRISLAGPIRAVPPSTTQPASPTTP